PPTRYHHDQNTLLIIDISAGHKNRSPGCDFYARMAALLTKRDLQCKAPISPVECCRAGGQAAVATARSKTYSTQDPEFSAVRSGLWLAQRSCKGGSIMKQLQDKVAIVTGATSGIGQAAARLFAQEGARLIVTGRRGDALDALVAQIQQAGGEALGVAGDIRSEALAERLVALALERFGGLDIAFNNAGMTGETRSVSELTLDQWQAVLDCNLTSAFLGAKYQLPALRSRGAGSIIFTSSFVGHHVGFPGMAAYAASKAALIGLTQVIAAEEGPHGIRANALLPGGTDTPMGRTATDTPEKRAFVENLHALKRLARPEEIARAALFLASDAASFVSGTAMLVEGGVSINRS
ncbi:SDR family oxidoreductase, partial [Pseudomonas protegens]|uniref:SDR family oxidoreductase n=1 Tax=Pseudomonas protegens TaxID=380021 RepID=UPI003906903B